MYRFIDIPENNGYKKFTIPINDLNIECIYQFDGFAKKHYISFPDYNLFKLNIATGRIINKIIVPQMQCYLVCNSLLGNDPIGNSEEFKKNMSSALLLCDEKGLIEYFKNNINMSDEFGKYLK